MSKAEISAGNFARRTAAGVFGATALFFACAFGNTAVDEGFKPFHHADVQLGALEDHKPPANAPDSVQLAYYKAHDHAAMEGWGGTVDIVIAGTGAVGLGIVGVSLVLYALRRPEESVV